MTLTTGSTKPWHVKDVPEVGHQICDANSNVVRTVQDWRDAELIVQSVNATGNGTTVHIAE